MSVNSITKLNHSFHEIDILSCLFQIFYPVLSKNYIYLNYDNQSFLVHPLLLNKFLSKSNIEKDLKKLQSGKFLNISYSEGNSINDFVISHYKNNKNDIETFYINASTEKFNVACYKHLVNLFGGTILYNDSYDNIDYEVKYGICDINKSNDRNYMNNFILQLNNIIDYEIDMSDELYNAYKIKLINLENEILKDNLITKKNNLNKKL